MHNVALYVSPLAVSVSCVTLRSEVDGKYPIATGLEHDEYGHPTGSPKLHMQMTAKRRKKLQALAATLSGVDFSAIDGAAAMLGFPTPQPKPRLRRAAGKAG